LVGRSWQIEQSVLEELQAIDVECGTEFSKVLANAETRGGFRLVCDLVANNRATSSAASLAYATIYLHQNLNDKANTEEVRTCLSAFAASRHLRGEIADTPFEVFCEQMRELNVSEVENEELPHASDPSAHDGWLTEEELEEIGRAIIEPLQAQISVAMVGRDFKDALLKLYRTGYVQGYIAGFAARLAR